MSTNTLVGSKVTTATVVRALDKDFPGWGAPGELDHFVDHPAGTEATIVGVESHGSNPWTRYILAFADGSHTAGGLGAKVINWS